LAQMKRLNRMLCIAWFLDAIELLRYLHNTAYPSKQLKVLAGC